MKKAHILFLTLAAALFLGGCGSSSNTADADKDTLVVLNYGKYLEPSVIEQFEQETGIHIKLEEYESPEEMYTKFTAGSICYDVVCTSDYMIERLISEGEVSTIDFSGFSNYGNLNPDIIDASRVFDPEACCSMPYFYGTLGILYNTTMVPTEEAQSWNILWDDTYRDSIIMQNSVRDTFVPALRLSGYDINTEDEDELADALALLIEQKPIVYAYYVDETADEMAAGNAAMALVYSGEAAYAMELNDDLSYAVPEEGSNLWIDSWFIPKTCKNTENAEKFLDFLCREDIARKNFDYVYYATPNTAVYNNLDDAIKKDTIIFPDQSVLENCEVYTSLNEEGTNLYNRLWKELKSD